jgi:hypothetical protein
MILNNDDARKREGCEVTYKQKKGFQPLHICWGPLWVDVIFRKGSAHSNHGTDYINWVRAIVESEKTAILMTGFYPGYCWMATGGLSNLSYSNSTLRL